MAHFIGHGLPGALGALVLAGLFAGTMSSFSAGLHSLSTATYADFIAPFRARRTDDRRDVQVAKRVTAVWGVAIVAAALLLGGRDTLFAILAKVMSPFPVPSWVFFSSVCCPDERRWEHGRDTGRCGRDGGRDAVHECPLVMVLRGGVVGDDRGGVVVERPVTATRSGTPGDLRLT